MNNNFLNQEFDPIENQENNLDGQVLEDETTQARITNKIKALGGITDKSIEEHGDNPSVSTLTKK